MTMVAKEKAATCYFLPAIARELQFHLGHTTIARNLPPYPGKSPHNENRR